MRATGASSITPCQGPCAGDADVRGIDVIVISGSDTIFNPIRARGIGEIGITGVSAAICNAVYHATGRRVRELPITLDTMIQACRYAAC
jgi:xanthine dehydrogenase YagR molybdenum-binding subunit